MWPRVMQTTTYQSFLLIRMFKSRKGGFITINISAELFFSNFGGKRFDKPCLQRGEHLNLFVETTRLEISYIGVGNKMVFRLFGT